MRLLNGARCAGETPLRPTRLFDTTPEFWINLQAQYDLEMARMEAGAAIEQEVNPLKAA